MLQNQKLLRITSTLFIVQSFTWFWLSLLCVLCIEDAIDVPTSDSYSKWLSIKIYLIFFGIENKNVIEDFDFMVVKPAVFEAFAFIHMFLAIAWITMSITTLYKSSSSRIQSLQGSVVIRTWFVIGYLVALIDIIFSILILIDLFELDRQGFNLSIVDSISPPIGVVFAIVSRGITLLIVNFTLIVILNIKMWSNLRKYRDHQFDSRFGNQYEGQGYNNNGYQPQHPQMTQQHQPNYPPAAQQYGDSRMAPAHQDFEPYRQGDTRPNMRSQGYPTNAPATNYAQIIRNPAPGRQSPPRLHAVAPPQIPEPDYQMGPRTVLKNHSQYDRY